MKKKLFCILSVIAILITSTVPVMAAMTSEGTSAEVGDYLVSYNAENYTVSVDGHSYVLDDVLKNRIQKGYSYSIICQSTFAFGYDLRFYIFTYSSSYSLGCWESGNYFFFLLDSSRNFITDSSLNPDAYLTEIIYTPSSASFKSVDSVFPYYPHSSSSSSYSDERFCKLISDPFCFFTTDNIYNVYVYSGGIGDSKYHLSVEDSYFFQPAPDRLTGELTAEQITEGLSLELIGVIPLVVGLVVFYLELRKGLRTLAIALHRA